MCLCVCVVCECVCVCACMHACKHGCRYVCMYVCAMSMSFIIIGNIFTAPENTVRLADGPNAYTGRVEVYINGTWGIVCDDGWNINAGHVVCRQLGFAKASAIHVGGEFGPGIIKTYLCKYTIGYVRIRTTYANITFIPLFHKVNNSIYFH